MSTIAKHYDPSKTEEKLLQYWEEQRFFESQPNEKKAFTVVIPPPNVTGILHMGHMLNNTIQDVLVRKARMQGKNACWIPGTDHASIATEAKVWKLLAEKGIKKESLTREEFLKHAWQWKEKHGGIILNQLKRLGASCDFKRTKFTMDEPLSKAVINTFVDLHNKGLIYKGVRMVNWDPAAQTAVSDEEVIHKEVASTLYYIKYEIEGSEDFITIATTRPETLLGDTAIAVNPKDERFKKYHGKKAIVPIVNRPVHIICDEYVDLDFGTGALKVTPAHDINDYNLGIKHKLESIDILNDDGTLNEHAAPYQGLDRFEVRKQIAKDLQEKRLLIKTEQIQNSVGFSERTDAVIEPKLSMQWFVKMQDLAKPALENVENDEIQFHPAKFKNAYRHWMTNIKDWCISRQLWWGQQIPAWYYSDSQHDFVVAATKEEALKLASEKTGKQINPSKLRQDDDVLDTWFSSWLWPISVFDGINNPNNKEIEYYYPTQDLVTAPEIMFFWVARMIMAGYEFTGKKPFSNVYYTGIVRDKQRRKMSKSLGNSPDPIELMQKYGTDGVRMGMLLSSPAGNDLLFDESLCEQGRNFSNKLWNAFRLVKSWQVVDKPQEEYLLKSCGWMLAKIDLALQEIEQLFAQYKLSNALMVIYKLIWDDFCAWYLELIKPSFGSSIDQTTYDSCIEIFEKLLKVLHPFNPFITEEIWHTIKTRTLQEGICVADWPVPTNKDASKLIETFEFIQTATTELRGYRKSKNLSFKASLEFYYKTNSSIEDWAKDLLIKVGNISVQQAGDKDTSSMYAFMNNSVECFIYAELNTEDKSVEIEKISAELDYTKGFLNSVMKKLNNKRFVDNAPQQVVQIEQKKKSDAESKIALLEKQLAALN